MDMQSINSHLPPDFWFKTGVFLVLVLVAILAVRIYQKSNKIYLTIVLGVIGMVIFFNWVYNRSEPKWLTPVVDKLAEFMPTKDYAKPDAANMK